MDRLTHLLEENDGVLLRRDMPELSSMLGRGCRSNRLSAVLPGVYLGISAATDWRVRALAVLLRYPDAVLCDQTAARITFWPELDSAVVHAAGIRRRSEAPGFAFSRRCIPVESVHRVGALRFTSPELTAVDLACHTDGESLDRVLRARQGTIAGLTSALNASPGRNGNSRRRRLLLDSRAEPWSTAERLAHKILRAAGILGWVANYRIRRRGKTYYLDIAFPGLKVVIEIDGRSHHQDSSAFENDRNRQNELVLDGWLVIRFTWTMLIDDPATVVRRVKDALTMAENSRRRAARMPSRRSAGATR